MILLFISFSPFESGKQRKTSGKLLDSPSEKDQILICMYIQEREGIPAHHKWDKDAVIKI